MFALSEPSLLLRLITCVGPTHSHTQLQTDSDAQHLISKWLSLASTRLGITRNCVFLRIWSPELLELSSVPQVQSLDPFLCVGALISATPTPSSEYADSPVRMRQVRGSEKLALSPKWKKLNKSITSVLIVDC